MAKVAPSCAALLSSVMFSSSASSTATPAAMSTRAQSYARRRELRGPFRSSEKPSAVRLRSLGEKANNGAARLPPCRSSVATSRAICDTLASCRALAHARLTSGEYLSALAPAAGRRVCVLSRQFFYLSPLPPKAVVSAVLGRQGAAAHSGGRQAATLRQQGSSAREPPGRLGACALPVVEERSGPVRAPEVVNV